MFAKDIAIANREPRRLVPVFQILWRVPDHAAGVKPIPRADARDPGDVDMRPQNTIRPNLHGLVHYGIGPDLDAGMQLGLRMNDRRWMNHAGLGHQIPAEMQIAIRLKISANVENFGARSIALLDIPNKCVGAMLRAPGNNLCQGSADHRIGSIEERCKRAG
jgi:hypothetical protein